VPDADQYHARQVLIEVERMAIQVARQMLISSMPLSITNKNGA
jgi:hypothetical protein